MERLLASLTLASACFLFASFGLAQNSPPGAGASLKGKIVSAHATGTFEVKVTPQPSSESPADPDLGRMTIEKQFHGALEGTSKGQMLTAGNPAKGSAGYVAIEKVTGTLDGRHGSFILQHNATINHGIFEMNIIVVPDSGTDQLVGLSGKMTIIITDGKHSYDFEYTLPAAQ
ncbi:MAG: DUF3224 domain-containing protein [Candidatus Acidiferrum sp.]